MVISDEQISTGTPVSSEIWGAPDLHKDAGYSNFVEISSDGFFRLVVATKYGRKVMLKSVRKEYADDLMYQELLHKEFEILMRLDHNFIVRVNDIEEIPDLGKCIVMEYVDGITLDVFLEDNKADKKTRLHLLAELIQTIDYLHSRQIVHRDLKPTNIMVLKGGEHLKVIDFGLADSSSYMLLKQPAGTSGYSSPEQQTEWKEDYRNDIYSLGKIMKDMKLGFRYNNIIKTCIGDISKRPSAKELLSMIEKIQRQNRIFAVAACFIGVVAIGTAATSQLSLDQESPIVSSASNQQVTEASLSGDTVTTKKQVPATKTTPVLGGKMESPLVNPKAYQAYLENGKKIIDKDAKVMDQMVDTLSSIEYMDGSPIEDFMVNEPFKLHDYANKYEKSLSKANFEAFMNELMTYYSTKTERWRKKIQELNDKYEKEHWR